VALSIPGCMPGMTALKNSAALVIRILVTEITIFMVSLISYDVMKQTSLQNFEDKTELSKQ